MKMTAPMDQIADEPSWFLFAKKLREALAAPEAQGFESATELLGAAAEARGVQSASLRNPLFAFDWLNQHMPGAGEKHAHTVSMTGVLMLAQIFEISPPKAEELLPRVLSGKCKRDELKDVLRQVKESSGNQGQMAHERALKYAQFEKDILEFLIENPLVLGLGQGIHLTMASRSERVPCDILAFDGTERVAAIEVKGPRQKVHNRLRVEVLGMMSLLSKTYPHAFLIAHSSWGNSLEEMAKQARDFELDNLQIASFDPAGELNFL